MGTSGLFVWLSIWLTIVLLMVTHSQQQLQPITVFMDGDSGINATRLQIPSEIFSLVPLNSTTVHVTNAVCRTLRQGSGLWLGLCSADVCRQLASFSQAMHIPLVISAAYHVSTEQPSYVLNVRPPTMTAVGEIVRKLYNWTEVLYITDSQTKFDQSLLLYSRQLSQLGNEVLKPYMRHFIVHSVEEAGALIKATVLRSPIRESQIIFDMPVGMVNAILRVMLQDDMVRQRHFHFVLASLDYQEIARDILRYSSNSFTALSMLDDSAKITTEDALVRDALGFIQSATPSLGASKRNISLDCAAAPYDTWANGENTIGLLRTHSYNGLTGKLTFNATGNRKGYQFGVMESLHGRNLTKRAVWSDTNGLHLLNNDTGDAKTPLKVVGILTDRFLMINACNSTPDVRTIRLSSSSADAAASDQCYTGFVVDLLHEFEITGNTFKLHHSQGHYYYGNNINGTWTGAVGELLQKNADLIVGDLSVIAERESVLDFTIPFMNDGFIILMQKDAQKTFDIFSFMSPFSARLWVSLLLALIVSFVIVLLVGRLSAMEWQRPSDQPRNGHRRLENQFTPQESLWLMIVTLLQQGPNIAPQSCATKIAVGSWYIWGFIVCATYTANLAAFLTLNRMTSTIQSVDDLVGQDEVRYGILEANMASTNFFRNSKEPIYERMWNTMQRRDTLVDSVKTGLERVRQGKFAFIGPKTVVDFADQGQPCDTRIVGQPLYYANYAVAVFSGSPLRKTFSEAILKLNENGVLKTLEKKWFSRDECTSGDGNSGAGNLIPLNPNEVSGLFLILAIGLTVSVAVALGEYFRIGRRRFRKYGVTFNEILLTARKPTDQSATENQSEMNLTSMDASSSQNSWLELKLPGTVAARDRH